MYHYTSAAALAGILSSKSLFCTDYRQLNDSTELGLGLEVLEAAIASRAIAIGAPCEAVSLLLNRLSLLRRASFHISMFCASFSMNRNDLAQWRAYAPNNGISIGFREPLLRQIAVTQSFVCGAVRYLGAPLFNEWLEQQLLAIRGGWEETARNESEHRSQARSNGQPDELTDEIINWQKCGNVERWAAEVAGLLKNPDFRSENEWRCVYVLRQNTIQQVRPVGFRPANGAVIRFVELDFTAVDLAELIARIDIGPGNSSATFETVSELCSAASLNAEVTQPFHAYRPVR